MSMLTYPSMSDSEIFNICRKECGIITTTEDLQYFALGCIYCSDKFLYFDAFIGHMQLNHASFGENGAFGDVYSDILQHNEEEELTEQETCLLVPQTVMIKEEVMDDGDNHNGPQLTQPPTTNDESNSFVNIKQEYPDINMEGDDGYIDDSFNYDDYDSGDDYDGLNNEDEDDANYDDLVEESLYNDTGLVMHIKDRRMIHFLIDCYRRNTFLWDHFHAQFRDRVKRQQFLDWIVVAFKRRFNVSLAKDAVTRKWDNLRTVYKRECNRMALEKTNISTLWYYKELHFLHRLYGGQNKLPEAVLRETVYRRRYSALWNDVSTTKLLEMVKKYPCFYDKYNVDYRSKEKRGEALQQMAVELQKIIDVSTIQISKRISQLRFDYSKQKNERVICEHKKKAFVSNFSYYEQMQFMDSDVAPFKCEYCSLVVQTIREMEVHNMSHQPASSGYDCSVCHLRFTDGEDFNRHMVIHTLSTKKYHCELCTASFRDKDNYEEHIRQHNNDLLLPTIPQTNNKKSESKNTKSSNNQEKLHSCEVCGKMFSQLSYLKSHRKHHQKSENFKCDYAKCGKTFASRQRLSEHVRSHYIGDDYKCDICGKGFKSSKNLHNHKQIHDAIKKYICKVCGSAFAQAAGLYLHKRRHNRPNARVKPSH